MDYQQVLRYIEGKLGPTPRQFNLIDRLTWFKQDKPDWDWKNDDIRHSVENCKNVFTHGSLSWGHIIQVNVLMFERSDDNCPGEVVIWNDDLASFDAKLLATTANKLYRTKGHSGKLLDAEEKKFAAYLENEMIRTYGLPVPKRFCNGVDLRVSTMFFQRRHIPGAVISSSLFPVLYLKEDPMVTAMVPYRFWPASYLKQWKYPQPVVEISKRRATNF